MKIRFKDGTEFKVTSIKQNIDHNTFFNNKLNNTTVVLNVSENEGVTVESLKTLLTRENVSEVTFIREAGNITDSFVRFAKIVQNIDEYGNQIMLLLSKDEYVANPYTETEGN